VPADRVDIGALGLQPIRLTQLPQDLLRRMPLPLQLSHLLAQSGDRDSHNDRTDFRGSHHLLEHRIVVEANQGDLAVLARIGDAYVLGVAAGITVAAAAIARHGQGGRILNMASGSGFRGTAGLAAYVASKHAVIGVTKVCSA
jgi:NAD(P)-dependent dehydrogenase (short-subunit alcohol dehydrogenase family)